VVYSDLPVGADHTVDYVPIVAEKKRFRYKFTVPGEVQQVGRRNFEFVGAS
jgi:hypothetical protein